MTTDADAQKCSAPIIRRLLKGRFSDTRRYVFAEEVAETTGWNRRRLDMVVCDVFKSSSFAIEGIEIKISKADLRHELEDSEKHSIFYENLDKYSLAAPYDVIKPCLDAIPARWGLYSASYSNGAWSLRCMRKPLDLHDGEKPRIARPFFASLLRKAACSSPSKEALSDEFERGRERGRRDRDHDVEHERRKAELLKMQLDTLGHIEGRFSFCDEESADRKIDRFLRFEALGVDRTIRAFEFFIEQSKEVIERAMAVVDYLNSEEENADVRHD